MLAVSLVCCLFVCATGTCECTTTCHNAAAQPMRVCICDLCEQEQTMNKVETKIPHAIADVGLSIAGVLGGFAFGLVSGRVGAFAFVQDEALVAMLDLFKHRAYQLVHVADNADNLISLFAIAGIE